MNTSKIIECINNQIYDCNSEKAKLITKREVIQREIELVTAKHDELEFLRTEILDIINAENPDEK